MFRKILVGLQTLYLQLETDYIPLNSHVPVLQRIESLKELFLTGELSSDCAGSSATLIYEYSNSTQRP
jgi:hypothetical protein